MSSLAFAQKEKIYTEGKIYWGAFDVDKKKPVAPLEEIGKIALVKKSDNYLQVDWYDYKEGGSRSIYEKDSNGDWYSQGKKWVIEPVGNVLGILSCDLLPLEGNTSKVFMLLITDLK